MFFRNRFIVEMVQNNMNLRGPLSLSWDYQFFLHQLANHRISVIPSINLVTNIGFDGKGNSAGVDSRFIYANMPCAALPTDDIKSHAIMVPFYRGNIFTLKNELGLNGDIRTRTRAYFHFF